MIEYKVGNKVYIVSYGGRMVFKGFVEIIAVGRRFSDAVAENGTLFKLNMAKNNVVLRLYQVVGSVYARKEDYDEKCAIEKFAAKIKRTVNSLGYSGLHKCSVGDLRKIAEILKINLDE